MILSYCEAGEAEGAWHKTVALLGKKRVNNLDNKPRISMSYFFQGYQSNNFYYYHITVSGLEK